MTLHDAGSYKSKHAGPSAIDPVIAAAIAERASDQGITCAAAHKIAEALSIEPAEIGKTIDLLEKRIRKCQLGLFGYQPQRRILKPASQVPAALSESLRAASPQGCIACRRVWEIAEKFSISRLEAAAACEALDLKIAPCQLGAF